MEISLLCGAKVMVILVDKNDKNLTYCSEDNPENFAAKYLTKKMIQENIISNDHVIFIIKN
jgi:hypothetical protein